MDNLKLILAGLVICALSYAAGYQLAPDKIKTVEKIVEVEKTTKEEHKKVSKEYDPNTGKLTKETEETGTKETNSSETKTSKETEKEKSQKLFAIKGGIAINPRNLNDKLIPRIGVEVKVPILPVFIGVEGDINVSRPLAGIYGRMEF